MRGQLDKDSIVCVIEQYLIMYDRVLIFDDMQEEIQAILTKLFQTLSIGETQKKILILSMQNGVSVGTVEHKQITPEEYQRILQFYNMYEFSNRVEVIAKNAQYGSILNYVKTGLLTEDDLLQIILK